MDLVHHGRKVLVILVRGNWLLYIQVRKQQRRNKKSRSDPSDSLRPVICYGLKILQPSPKVPAARDEVFKCMYLWGTFHSRAIRDCTLGVGMSEFKFHLNSLVICWVIYLEFPRPGFLFLDNSHSSEPIEATPHGRWRDGYEHLALCVEGRGFCLCSLFY